MELVNILELLKKHEVDIQEENVLFVCEGGTIEVSFEDGKLDVKVYTIDRVVHIPETKIDDLVQQLLGVEYPIGADEHEEG